MTNHKPPAKNVVTPIVNPDKAALAAATQGKAGDPRARRTAQRARNNERHVQRFNQWCVDNDQTAFPASEQTVLRYLYSQVESWSPRTMNHAAKAINTHHRQQGAEPPCGRRTSRFLKGVRLERPEQTKRIQPAVAPTDPIRLYDVHTLMLHNQPTQTTDTQWLAYAIRDTQLSGRVLASLRVGEEIQVNQSVGVATLTVSPEQTVLVSATQHPRTFERLANNWKPGGQPFEVGRHPLLTMRTAARNQELPDPWFDGSAYNKLTDLDFQLHVAVLEKYRGRYHWRNETILLVGVLCAFRWSDMECQRIEDTKRTPEGYRLLVPYSKTDPTGEGRLVYLTHADEGNAGKCHAIRPCDLLCPVAALDRHLYYQRVHLKRSTGWLLVRNENSTHPLSVKQASNVLRDWWRDAGLPEAKSISSRSLRVGGATTAHEQRWPIREIAEQLTNHRDVRTTGIYLRSSTERKPIVLDPYRGGRDGSSAS